METKDLFKVIEVVILLVGVAAFVVKNDQLKQKLVAALLVLCTVLVGGVFSQAAIKRDKEAKSAAVMEAGQAEFLMRMAAAMQAMTDALPVSGKLGAAKGEDSEAKLHKLAAQSMSKAVGHDGSLSLIFKNAVLLAEIGERSEFRSTLNKLSALGDKDKRAGSATRLLEALYVSRHLPAAEVEPSIKLVADLTDQGFFRDVINLEVYKSADAQSKKFKEACELYSDRNRDYALRLLAAMAVIAMLVLAGTLALFISLFFLPRKLTAENELAEIRAPAYYGFRRIYGVFIGWLTLECFLAPAVVEVIRQIKGNNHDPAMTGVLTMVVYLVNNLPALILAWFIAIKPAGAAFMPAVKLRLRTSKFGPWALIFLGWSTWLSAIPIILLCSMAAKNFLGAEGSSNPILTVVMQSTRGHDPLLTALVFIVAIGVLPALCEETLFRGFLYTSLRCRFGALVSMVISAAIFAAVHMDVGAFAQLFSLGFLFALIFERTRSLIPSMIAHCLWNSGTFVLMMVLFGA